MTLSTQPYKGARDFYPEDKRLQKYMFGVVRRVVESFGYEEYDAPIIEPVELYLSKSSEEIITEQTYNFMDRGGRHVTLRPEMTPTVSRMVAARRQELSYPLRWYSIPNVWRYERPQRGRLREHWQLNVDLFGVAGLPGEHEQILLADSILKALGAKPGDYSIRINNRKLVDSILRDLVGMDDEHLQKVMRFVDHRAKMPHDEFREGLAQIVSETKARELLKIFSVKSFADLPEKYQNTPSAQDILGLRKMLANSGITNVIEDISLMRGFDYYTDIVFEVFDEHPDNNRSMFGGGRYDGLVAAFGVAPLPTIGFAVGDVTLQIFLEGHKLLPALPTETDAVVVLIGDVYEAAQKALAYWRREGLNLAVDSSERKVDAGIKSAAKAGTPYIVFIGEQELATGRYKLKNLDSGDEQELDQEEVAKILKAV